MHAVLQIPQLLRRRVSAQRRDSGAARGANLQAHLMPLQLQLDNAQRNVPQVVVQQDGVHLGKVGEAAAPRRALAPRRRAGAEGDAHLKKMHMMLVARSIDFL